MSATVHAIVLNWRSAGMTLRAAQACLAAMDGVEGALTVVDNDSQDGSEEALRAEAAARGWTEPRVRILQAGRNGGFGAGNNAAIRAGLPGGARPDFHYILNSDAFPDADAIRILRDHLIAHPEAGMAGSRLVGEDGQAHVSTFRFPSVAAEFEGQARSGPITRLLRDRTLPLPPPTATGRVDWLAGASLMIREDVIREVGDFDEGFFLYYEETDLCLRAARAGWETHVVPASQVTHLGSVSTGMKQWSQIPEYWFDSRLRYFAKNHGRATAAAATLAHVAGAMVHRARRGFAGRRADDPPRTLRRLVAHDLRAGFRPGASGDAR